MDWKSITTMGMDTNKDKTYNRDFKRKEDWNKERTREFSSITKK